MEPVPFVELPFASVAGSPLSAPGSDCPALSVLEFQKQPVLLGAGRFSVTSFSECAAGSERPLIRLPPEKARTTPTRGFDNPVQPETGFEISAVKSAV